MTKKSILLTIWFALFFSLCCSRKDGIVMTVNGPIPVREMGVTLVHEHILVDFTGADSISESRWDRIKVVERSLPFLKQIKELGCRTMVECTPSFLGKDPILLKTISDLGDFVRDCF